MQMCATTGRGGTPQSAGGLFRCELDTAMRLNRAVLGEAWASQVPLGVEALLAHLLAIDGAPGWLVSLLDGNPIASVDVKQMDRLIRSLNRIHRIRGHRRKTQQASGAAEVRMCSEAVESSADRHAPGSVALCTLLRFLEQLQTPLVNPELMPRVLDHFRSAGPLSSMDISTRNSVCRGLHAHTQLGLLEDPLCRKLVERITAFARDFAVIHGKQHVSNEEPSIDSRSSQKQIKPDSRILTQLSRILGPAMLQSGYAGKDNATMALVFEGQPTVAEAADIFHLMASETGFIFGDDPHPGGISSDDDQTVGNRRQHHRVNSWLVSQQLEPIHEDSEMTLHQPQQWLQEERTAEVRVLQQDQEIKNFSAVSAGLEPTCALMANSVPPIDADPKSTCLGMCKCTWFQCIQGRRMILWMPTTDAISREHWYDRVIMSGAMLLTISLVVVAMGYWKTVSRNSDKSASSSSSWPLPSDSGTMSDQHFTGVSPMDMQNGLGLARGVLKFHLDDGDYTYVNGNTLCEEVTDGATGTVAAGSTMPWNHRHYEMLRVWVGNRTERVVSRVQAVSQLLGFFVLRFRTIAYSYLDALLVSNPS